MCVANIKNDNNVILDIRYIIMEQGHLPQQLLLYIVQQHIGKLFAISCLFLIIKIRTFKWFSHQFVWEIQTTTKQSKQIIP